MSVYQWTGSNNADLGNGSNWADTTEPGMGQPPGTNDVAIIEVGAGLFGTLNVSALDLVQASGAAPISITGSTTSVTAASVGIGNAFTLDDGAFLKAGTLGIDGDGTAVSVQNNADLFVSAGQNDVFTIGASAGKATLLVTKGGTVGYDSLAASGTLNLGGVSNSVATLTVSAGGYFDSTLSAINIGAASGATGVLNVSGAGSQFLVDNYGSTTIGDYGERNGSAQGTVSVTGGGYASLSSDGEVDVGTSAGMAKILVSGANSAVEAGPFVEVGVSGTNIAGEIVVSAGGEFDSATDTLLNNGTVSVSGANSLFTARFLDTDSGTTVSVGTGGLIHVADLNLDGTLKLTGGSVNVRANLNLYAGSLTYGYGTIADATVANGGTIKAQSGTLDVNGDVSGTGAMTISSAATLELDAAVASTQTLTFTGTHDVLLLKDVADFKGTVAGLVATETLDLAGLSASGTKAYYTANAGSTGGTLIVKNATTRDVVTLSGQYVAAGFHVAADGAGTGTAVAYTPPAQAHAGHLAVVHA